MPRSSLTWIALAALGAGCAAPKQVVFVDVDSLLIQAPAPISRSATPSPPLPMPAVSATIPAQPAEHVADRAGASGQRIRDLVAAEQTQALKDLKARLRKFYEASANRFELSKERTAKEAEKAAYAKAGEDIRAAFDAYADQRMPVYVDLTLFAGFPDPNPTSKPPDTTLNPVQQQRFTRTVKLRSDLQTIDDDFQSTVDKILAAVQDATAADRAAMRLEIEKYKEELDRKAEAEASSQIKQNASDLGLTLIEPLDLTLPATQAHSVTISAGRPMPPAPEVPTPGILSSTQDQEKLIRHELSIWLGLNRYTLGAKGKAQDRTQEFTEWRKTFELGR